MASRGRSGDLERVLEFLDSDRLTPAAPQDVVALIGFCEDPDLGPCPDGDVTLTAIE